MMQKGVEVVGIDPCNALVGETSQRFFTGMFRRMDMRWLKYPPETFTGIWAALFPDQSLRVDISRILKEFGRVLRPDGVLSINIGEDQDESLDPSKTEQRLYTIHDFRESLVEAKFQLLEEYICIQDKTLEGSQTKTRTYIFAKKMDAFTRPKGDMQGSECSFCSMSRFRMHRQIGLQGISSMLWGGDGLNRPAGGLQAIDVSEYQPFRTTGRTTI
jgi:hypothetical protein